MNHKTRPSQNVNKHLQISKRPSITDPMMFWPHTYAWAREMCLLWLHVTPAAPSTPQISMPLRKPLQGHRHSLRCGSIHTAPTRLLPLGSISIPSHGTTIMSRWQNLSFPSEQSKRLKIQWWCNRKCWQCAFYTVISIVFQIFFS